MAHLLLYGRISSITPDPRGGGKKPPPSRGHPPAADGDPGASWSAAFRAWLRATYGASADVILDLVGGRIPYEHAARQLGVERWQLWRLVRSALAEIRWAWVGHQAIEALAREDGFTLDCRTGQLVHPTGGFAVAVHGATTRARNPTGAEAGAYARKYRAQLLGEGPPSFYFGGWLNQTEDVYEFDLTRVVPGFDDAMALALAERQCGVYSFADGRVLPTSGRDRREAA